MLQLQNGKFSIDIMLGSATLHPTYNYNSKIFNLDPDVTKLTKK